MGTPTGWVEIVATNPDVHSGFTARHWFHTDEDCARRHVTEGDVQSAGDVGVVPADSLYGDSVRHTWQHCSRCATGSPAEPRRGISDGVVPHPRMEGHAGRSLRSRMSVVVGQAHPV